MKFLVASGSGVELFENERGNGKMFGGTQLQQESQQFISQPEKIIRPAGYALRDYQAECIEAFERNLAERKRKQLVVMATGLGKTVIAAELIRRCVNRGQRALFLAHRDELIEQAMERIRAHVYGGAGLYEVQREQGEYYSNGMAEVVVASVATLGRKASPRLQQFSRDGFGLVVTDEFHHAVADSYQRVLGHFEPAAYLGITATPIRTDGEDLAQFFDTVAYRLDIVEAMLKGLIVPVTCHRISSRTDLSGVRTTAGDYNQRDLADRVNNQERNSLVVSAYRSFKGRRAIVFATSVEHAQMLAEEFNNTGVSAAYVSGDLDKAARKRAIADYRSGNLQVLCNFNVLIEGFDDEATDLIVNARPTQSGLLVTQMIGRGTRQHSGKTALDYVELIDLHSEKTATAAQVFGFRKTFDSQEHDFVECINLADRIEAEYPLRNPYGSHTFDELVRKLESGSTKVGTQSLQSTDLDMGTIIGAYRFYRSYAGSFMTSVRKDEFHCELRLIPSPLGGWEYSVMDLDTGEILSEASGPNREGLTTKLEQWLRDNNPLAHLLLDQSASWRERAEKEPVTEKQWNSIQRNDLYHGPKERLSKGAASRLLEAYFASLKS